MKCNYLSEEEKMVKNMQHAGRFAGHGFTRDQDLLRLFMVDRFLVRAVCYRVHVRAVV